MRGTFLAQGPSFKREYYSKKPVKVIDVYALMCKLLHVQPDHAHNGSYSRIRHFLNDNLLRNDEYLKIFNEKVDIKIDEDEGYG